MKNLIKIEERDGKRLVNARELWKGLESETEFRHWVNRKVVSNVFFEKDVDWAEVLPVKSDQQKGRGGRNKKDYALTLDTAKKVAMSEQTPKGNEVRNYFLECEKKIGAIQKVLPSNYIEALKQLVASEESKQKVINQNETLLVENKEMEIYIKETQPKLDYLDTILNSNDALLVTQIATDYDLSARKLNKILHEQGIQWKAGKQWNLYDKHRKKGYIKTESFTVRHKNGMSSTKSLTKWTQAGRLMIHEMLVGLGIEPINDVNNGE